MSNIKSGFDVIQQLVSGKWKSLILYHLGDSNKRTKELLEICEGVSHKVLAEQLKQLQQDGLLTRTVYAEEVPIKVEYGLTDYGRSFLPLLADICAFGDSHLEQQRGGPVSHKLCQL